MQHFSMSHFHPHADELPDRYDTAGGSIIGFDNPGNSSVSKGEKSEGHH